jgi:fibronectin-binding autotransporter adhesin
LSVFTVTPNAAQPASLTLGSFAGGSNNTQHYRGTSLGAAPGNGVANIYLTAAPALVGGGGAAGTTNISIIPTAVGSIASSGSGSTGTDLVTYGATGVRPLSKAAGEYATLAAANPTDNVLVDTTTATSGSKTMNALVLGGATATPLTQTGTDVQTVTSGTVVFAGSAFPQHTFDLNFGAARGLFNVTNNGPTYNGRVSGSGGLLLTGSGITLGGASTFSGPVTVANGGTVTLVGDVLANAPGPLGSSSDPIIIEPGNLGATIGLPNVPAPTITIGRDIIARGNGSGGASISNSVLGNGTVTVNGTITLERQLNVSASPFSANGVMQGTGRLSVGGTTLLNTANTYSGGTILTTGRVYAGNDNAFGTGTIYFSATGTGAGGTGTIGAVGAPRTIANPLVVLGSLSIGNAPLVGTAADITFTGDVNLGGGNSGTTPADGPCILTVPTGITAAFSGPIHDGGISKAGGGKLILRGNNIYTGGTTVSAGTLQVDNTVGSGTGSNFVNVLSGGMLSGTGVIAGPVSVDTSSTLSPGDSPGTLTTGALTLANGTSLLFDLDVAGITGSGINDLDAVNGNLVLDGALTVSAGANFGSGTYPLFTYSGSLTDNTVIVNPLPSGYTGTIDTTTTGVVSLNVVSVPEPATLGLLAVASSLALGRRTRRARRCS